MMKNRVMALLLIICLMPINSLKVNATVTATDQDTFFEYLKSKNIKTETNTSI